MGTNIENYDTSDMVDYHYGQFPPSNLDLAVLIEPLSLSLIHI